MDDDVWVAHKISLATEIEDTINRFSIKEGPDNKSIPVEQGFRLLGTPVGSRDFANKYYHNQLTMVTEGMQSLLTQIDNQQTRLKLFSKCTIQKQPHLLASDTMHNLDISEPAHDWYNYNGSLVSGIDTITKQFFNALLHQEEDWPTYATLITHLSTKSRGLGILNASLRAAPDFILTTMMSTRRATQGFITNKDLQPIKLHSSITDLYNTKTNKYSANLKRYHHLLPTFARLSCSDKCPNNELITRFEQHTSLHSARSRIKQYCDRIVTGQLFSTMYNNAPEHLHLLPSILSPQTSYPLIDMNRSNSAHRLPNWAFDIALRRKLQLPIFKHHEKCKCGVTDVGHGTVLLCRSVWH
jgi:hypothetical protein